MPPPSNSAETLVYIEPIMNSYPWGSAQGEYLFMAYISGSIELVFGEPVTFKGRRYLDKMKHDKVEMLYWLQQWRRVHHLVWAKRASHQSALSRKLSSQPLIAPGNTPITLTRPSALRSLPHPHTPSSSPRPLDCFERRNIWECGVQENCASNYQGTEVSTLF